MNRVSHMVFAFSLFVGLYSVVYAYSVWQALPSQLFDFFFYYIVGGFVVMIVTVPILYYKAPHKDMAKRTSSNRSSVGAFSFVTFCIGTLAGIVVYQLISGITIIGNLSIFIGAFIMVSGALMPDWDIPFLGISRHRNIIFHSAVLPILVVMTAFINVFFSILTSTPLAVGAHLEFYVSALFLLGYASHLYLDIFPSNSNPLEILWRAVDVTSKAPTGLKPLGSFKISKKNARNFLVSNATLLVIIAIAFFALYFTDLLALSP